MTSDAEANGVDDREVLSMLQDERRELCSWLDALAAHGWDAPSLCNGWAVRDVVAHLTLSTRESLGSFVRGLIRHAGSFDRMTRVRAQARARSFSPGELVQQLRASAESTRTSVGSSYQDALLDVIVHGHDIARPLGRHRSTAPERTLVALDHALTSRWYGARQRLAHAALSATDAPWTGGSGTQRVSGPAADLLLVATGRPTGLDNLRGEGVAELRRQLLPNT